MDDGWPSVRSKGVQERTQGGSGRIEICVEAMSPGSRERLLQYLRDTHGLDAKIRIRGAQRVSILQFTTSASEKFQRLVAPFVHPSIASKLLPRFCGQFAVKPDFVEPVIRPVPAQVLDSSVKREYPMMSRSHIEVA